MRASQETAPLDVGQPPDAGERKLVTVLCCGLPPARGQPEQGDLDTLHQPLQALYDLAQREAGQYGGTVQSVVGDQVLVVFGLPVAQEDHAQRAVLAALGQQQQLHARRAAAALPDTPLVGCIGLHTGLVAIGGLGAKPAAAVAVIGDMVNVAMALQAQAAPGAIVCSATTARLVQGMVRLVARTPVALGGQSPPMPVYERRGRRERQPTYRFLHTRLFSPFVGRVQEIATLEALLAQVDASQGHIVGIVGEPGMGKSRLVYEFRRGLRGRRLTYLAGAGLAYGQYTPYLPVLTLLRASCGLAATDGPAAMAAKVHQRLTEVSLSPEEWAPYLLRLLEVPTETDPLATLSPQALRARTIEALVQLTLHGARRQPLVLEVENLHWIDPSSEEVLAALAERLGGTALLLLTTYRPGYRPPWLDKSYASQVALSRLSPADSRRVVQAIQGPRPLPEALVQAILAKADGNPFFLEELARTVVDHDAAQLLPSVVPGTVQAVLAARMDRLPPMAKRLLQVAAIIGKDVPLPQLRAVADLPEETLDEQLALLQAGEFLYEVFLEGTPTYTFTHALTQEVAYGSLLQEWRRAIHRRIIEVIEALYPNRLADQVEWLAHHALRGEVWDKAVAYYRQAGAKAATRWALREAATAFEQALVALQQLPDSRATREQAIDLRIDLSRAL